eukprot:2033792-Rhodomonas_salina.1
MPVPDIMWSDSAIRSDDTLCQYRTLHSASHLILATQYTDSLSLVAAYARPIAPYAISVLHIAQQARRQIASSAPDKASVPQIARQARRQKGYHTSPPSASPGSSIATIRGIHYVSTGDYIGKRSTVENSIAPLHSNIRPPLLPAALCFPGSTIRYISAAHRVASPYCSGERVGRYSDTLYVSTGHRVASA